MGQTVSVFAPVGGSERSMLMWRLDLDTLALKASSLEWLHTLDISSKATGATNWAKERGVKQLAR